MAVKSVGLQASESALHFVRKIAAAKKVAETPIEEREATIGINTVADGE
jgi:hypothetical protein